MAEDTRDKGLTKAYGVATKKLRDAHRDEFNRLYQAEAKAMGLEWTPRPTASEKARAQLLSLLEEHPDLAAEVADRVGTKA